MYHLKLNSDGITSPCYFTRITTWCQSKATHVKDSLPRSRFMLVILVNIYKSLITCYLLLHNRYVRTSTTILIRRERLPNLEIMAKTFWVLPEKTNKTSVLLKRIEQKKQIIFETFSFDNTGDEMKLVPVLEKFYQYSNPRKNITILRLNLLHIDNMKGKASMVSSENWKKLVQNVNLKLSVILF